VDQDYRIVRRVEHREPAFNRVLAMNTPRHDLHPQRLPVVLRRVHLVRTHDQNRRGIRERSPHRSDRALEHRLPGDLDTELVLSKASGRAGGDDDDYDGVIGHGDVSETLRPACAGPRL
jgi:hypothetical protein